MYTYTESEREPSENTLYEEGQSCSAELHYFTFYTFFFLPASPECPMINAGVFLKTHVMRLSQSPLAVFLQRERERDRACARALYTFAIRRFALLSTYIHTYTQTQEYSPPRCGMIFYIHTYTRVSFPDLLLININKFVLQSATQLIEDESHAFFSILSRSRQQEFHFAKNPGNSFKVYNYTRSSRSYAYIYIYLIQNTPQSLNLYIISIAFENTPRSRASEKTSERALKSLFSVPSIVDTRHAVSKERV